MKSLVVALAVLSLPSLARAQDLKDRFNIKLIAQGLYEGEQQSAIPSGYGREAQQSSPFELGYGELRAVIDGRRLPGNFDLHIDARARITGEYDTDAQTIGANEITARGYLGGREYEVRQAWVRRRGENVDFGLGRMVVNEADALKLDGLRLWWRIAKHWDLSLYAGAYPDPYSRSITTDYDGGFAFAGGVDTTYTYDKIWGSVSVNSSYLGGNNDGSPITATGVGTPTKETPRTWITWTDYVRFVSWLDLFTDLVVDATGSAGAQLTRLDALATIRAGKHLTLHVGYDHMSAIAIEMWLTRLLQGGANFMAGTVENNLIVERTARDEVRGDATLDFGKLSIFADGRFRKRALITLSQDPVFVGANGQQVAPGLAYDVTFGVRDRGSVAGIRAGLWTEYIADFRAKNFIFGVDLGRGFLDDRLNFDFSFLYADTRDEEANNPLVPTGSCVTTSYATVNAYCYGNRSGAEFEPGLTATFVLSNHWFMFLDYRFVIDTSGGIIVPAVAATMTTPALAALTQPTIYTHVLLLRLEARY